MFYYCHGFREVLKKAKFKQIFKNFKNEHYFHLRLMKKWSKKMEKKIQR